MSCKNKYFKYFYKNMQMQKGSGAAAGAGAGTASDSTRAAGVGAVSIPPEVKINIITINKNTPTTVSYWNIDGKRIIKPLKYKEEEENINAIIFPNEDIIFSIKSFQHDWAGRIFVTILGYNYATNASVFNTYYTSVSDGTFWRYCFVDDRRSDKILDKGYNYTTTTMINFKLQKFIFDQQSKFNTLDTTKHPHEICNLRSQITPKLLLDRLTTTDSIASHYFFKIFNTVFPNIYGRTHDICDMFNNYSQCHSVLSRDSVWSEEETPYVHELKKSLHKQKVYDLPAPGFDQVDFYRKIYIAFEDYFLKYFKYLPETCVKIISKKIINVWEYDVIANVYSVDISEIVSKRNDPAYTVYYMVYKYKKYIRDPFSDDIKKSILHIVPKSSNMTIYGLDSRYVDAGFFINKIFDYKANMPSFPTDGRSNGDYIFIGDIVNMPSLPYDARDSLP